MLRELVYWQLFLRTINHGLGKTNNLEEAEINVLEESFTIASVQGQQ